MKDALSLTAALHKKAALDLHGEVHQYFGALWSKYFRETPLGHSVVEVQSSTGPVLCTLDNLHKAYRTGLIATLTPHYQTTAVNEFIKRVEQMEQMITPPESAE